MLLSILKRFWREITIVILIIIIGLSVKTCSERGDTIALLDKSRDSVFNKLTEVVTKNGELVTRINTYEVTVKQLKDHSDALGVDKKKLEKQVGNLNNLVGYWKGKAGVRDSIWVLSHDTVFVDGNTHLNLRAFNWKNEFIDIRGWSGADSTLLYYDYSVDFSLTTYRQRSGFLNLKKGNLLTDIYFSDPNFKVTEFKGLVTKEPPKTFIEKDWWKVLGAFIGGYLIGVK
jgi:hypothetical protein